MVEADDPKLLELENDDARKVVVGNSADIENEA